MKLKLLLSLFALSSSFVFSQNNVDKTVYFDSIWKETTEANFYYYRIIKDYYIEKDSYKVYDYYKSGAVQMEGLSKTKDYLTKDGEFIFYYENGNKESISNYSKSRLVGKQQQWYKNGTKKSEGEYFESKNGLNNDFKLNQFWKPEGKQIVVNGDGYYEESTEKYSESGNVKNGLRDGIWKGEYNERKRKYTETYKKGELVSGVSTDEENNQYKYEVIESRPEPKRGIQHFYKYIGANFRVPKECENIKGKILTQFIVDKSGKIVEPTTTKSLNPVLDQEAIRVITSYENWVPAKQRGQFVRVLYSIPISL
jgi:antitoxin component YwqK of YwqJK toxin-antitoxin module